MAMAVVAATLVGLSLATTFADQHVWIGVVTFLVLGGAGMRLITTAGSTSSLWADHGGLTWRAGRSGLDWTLPWEEVGSASLVVNRLGSVELVIVPARPGLGTRLPDLASASVSRAGRGTYLLWVGDEGTLPLVEQVVVAGCGTRYQGRRPFRG